MHRHAFRGEQTSRNRPLVTLLFNVFRFDASGPAARTTISFYWRLRKIENVTAHRRRFIRADDLTTLSPKLYVYTFLDLRFSSFGRSLFSLLTKRQKSFPFERRLKWINTIS